MPEMSRAAPEQVGRRLKFDRDTLRAVEQLAEDQMKDMAEIVEEALRDLLKKYGRSADLREQLRLSAGVERKVVSLASKRPRQ